MHTIGLDYDGTFTLHPETWEKVIETWKIGGMYPIFVTMRFKYEPLITSSDSDYLYRSNVKNSILFTSRFTIFYVG